MGDKSEYFDIEQMLKNIGIGLVNVPEYGINHFTKHDQVTHRIVVSVIRNHILGNFIHIHGFGVPLRGLDETLDELFRNFKGSQVFECFPQAIFTDAQRITRVALMGLIQAQAKTAGYIGRDRKYPVVSTATWFYTTCDQICFQTAFAIDGAMESVLTAMMDSAHWGAVPIASDEPN